MASSSRTFNAVHALRGLALSHLGGALLATILCLTGASAFAVRAEIGYDDLVNEYTGLLPDGSGVNIGMVEAENLGIAGQYMPNVNNSELVDVTFINGSSSQFPSPTTSNHATMMALWITGDTLGIATKVPQITVYEADYFLNSVLRLSPSNAGAPLAPSYKVLNNSWVGAFEDDANNVEALGRLDYLANTYDVIVPAGVYNGSANAPFELLSYAYNVISVGRTDGNHTRGPTDLAGYGPGRLKPEIVGPRDTTSANTAVVSSVATMLYQSATDTVHFPSADPQAAKSETMKAILMAGATKQEFPTWENASPTQPLDTIYGAGEVNVYNSFFIQQGGQFDGQSTSGGARMGDYGWDYGELSQGGSLFYELEVPDFYTGGELSVVLAWNALVTDGNSGAAFDPVLNLANLDLKLYDEQGLLTGSPLAISESNVDNVEHIYLPETPVGKYTLEVLYNTTDNLGAPPSLQDFGIAWRLDSEAPYRATGDYNQDGVVDSADYTLWRDLLGSSIDLAADGDLNGVVDQGDYLVWQNAFGSTHTPPMVTITSLTTLSAAASQAVGSPEPAAAVMLATLFAAGLLAPRRSR
ncbi:MAG: hypothetical protein KDA37_01155 [Planctomycetales bacterium]|nr:hypothetical protein [Planctomycetales bacterium]